MAISLSSSLFMAGTSLMRCRIASHAGKDTAMRYYLPTTLIL